MREFRQTDKWAQMFAKRHDVQLRYESMTPGNVPAYKYEESGNRVVVLNSTIPTERQNFSLAHEVAHILLKHTGAPSPDEEFEANHLASELMFPEDDFRSVAEYPLRKLKSLFPHASFEAIARRRLQFIPGVLTVIDNKLISYRINSSGFSAPAEISISEKEFINLVYDEQRDMEVTLDSLLLSATYIDDGRGVKRVLLLVEQDESFC